MTEIGANFLSEDRQLFPRSVGELLALYVKRKWPRDTAKHVSRAFDTDPTTAANVVKSHASERLITKAIRSEGWPLLMALGEQLTGQTYAQHLQHMIEEADNVRRIREQHRTTVSELEARAADVVGLLDRQNARQAR